MSVLDNLTKRVSNTAKAAAKKSGNVVELTRLNMSIGTEEEKIKKIHYEMGKMLYDVYLEGGQMNDELTQYCEKIDVVYKSIEEMKAKILELRNVKACLECGNELEIEMAFCYKCGKKQDADECVVEEDIN